MKMHPSGTALFAVVILLICISSCSKPVAYYKRGATNLEMQRDFRECGAIYIDGKPTYLSSRLPDMDKCLKNRGYSVDLAPQVTWTKDGASEETARADGKKCGVKYDIFMGTDIVQNKDLKIVDECMRKRGYSLNLK